MRNSRLRSVFVPATETVVRASLSSLNPQNVPPIVEASAPEARQLVAEGALCLIPAEGGVVVAGDVSSSIEQALENLASR